MKKKFLTAGALAVLLVTGIVACSDSAGNTAKVAEAPEEDMLTRGEYLVNAIGCDDCHTPKNFGPKGPEPDMANRFAGHLADRPTGPIDTAALSKGWALFGPELTVAVGPWGVSYAANISSDSTGIGAWTLEQFTKSLREGKYKGLDNSRPLLPPMPWYNFAKLKDNDIEAIFTYLKASKPVKNVVPAYKPLSAL